MFWFQLLIVAGVVFAIAAVAAGYGDAMGEAHPDRPDLILPSDRPLDPSDVAALRLSVGFRGYRMDEVDDVLDRLAAELASRDARIAELEAGQGPAASAAGGP